MSIASKDRIKHIQKKLQQLPTEMLELWHTTDDIIAIFRKGGLYFITKEDVITALQCKAHIPFIFMNRKNNVRHYCFGHQSKEKPPCYHSLQAISKHMPKDYFLGL